MNAAGREALALARDDADSGLESLLRWRLRHLDLRVRTQQSVVGVRRVDILIGERLLVHDGELVEAAVVGALAAAACGQSRGLRR